MGETLADGEGNDLDRDPLGRRVLGGVENLQEVALDDGGADAVAAEDESEYGKQLRSSSQKPRDAPRLGKLVGVSDELRHVDAVGRAWSAASG